VSPPDAPSALQGQVCDRTGRESPGLLSGWKPETLNSKTLDPSCPSLTTTHGIPKIEFEDSQYLPVVCNSPSKDTVKEKENGLMGKNVHFTYFPSKDTQLQSLNSMNEAKIACTLHLP